MDETKDKGKQNDREGERREAKDGRFVPDCVWDVLRKRTNPFLPDPGLPNRRAALNAYGVTDADIEAELDAYYRLDEELPGWLTRRELRRIAEELLYAAQRRGDDLCGARAFMHRIRERFLKGSEPIGEDGGR